MYWNMCECKWVTAEVFISELQLNDFAHKSYELLLWVFFGSHLLFYFHFMEKSVILGEASETKSDSTVICFRKWFEWDKTGQGEALGQHEPETHAERRDRRVWEVLSLLMQLLCLGTALRGVMLFLQIHVMCCPCLRHSPSLPPPALSFFLPWLSLSVSYLIFSVFPLTEISAHMHLNTHTTLAPAH